MTAALICFGAMLAILCLMAVVGFDEMCRLAKADPTHVARFRSENELRKSSPKCLSASLRSTARRKAATAGTEHDLTRGLPPPTRVKTGPATPPPTQPGRSL